MSDELDIILDRGWSWFDLHWAPPRGRAAELDASDTCPVAQEDGSGVEETTSVEVGSE